MESEGAEPVQDFEHQRLVPLSVTSSDQSDIDVPALLRKMHKHLLPICVLILVFANIDRGNLGFVANQLCRDLDLTHTEYGTGASAFFVGFLFSRIPSNLAMRYFGGPLWLTILVFSWGVLAAALAFMTNVYHFYFIRFLLGVAEGGAFPGVWYYITMFFPDDYLTIPYAWMACAAPIGTAISGPLAALFTLTDNLFGIAYWRYLLFFEGFLPAILAPLLFVFLPENIDRARFLSSHERDWLQHKKDRFYVGEHRTVLQELNILVTSLPFWMMCGYFIVHLMLFAIIMYWTTLMIEDSFSSDENKDTGTCASSRSVGLLSIITTAFVFVFCTMGTWALGWSTKNSTSRNLITGWVTILCGVSLALWPVAQEIHAVLGLILLTIAACAMNAPTATLAGLLVSHFDSRLKSTALSVGATVATLGGLIGPIMLGKIVDHYDDYYVASLVAGTIGVAGGILILFVKDPLKTLSSTNDEE